MSDTNITHTSKRIYLASSWRNEDQQRIVELLRAAGHEVYDFKNPPNRSGFGWESVNEGWKGWSPREYVEALEHPVAEAGFAADFEAMQWADTCVLLLPAGASAALELGWCAGAGKRERPRDGHFNKKLRARNSKRNRRGTVAG